MASVVMLKNPKTGIIKKGFYGFSWTTFFFGGFPALFRGDFVLGLVFIVLQFLTWGISGIIVAFFYNKRYTTKLIEEGYEFADSEGNVAMARAKLSIVQVGAPSKQMA
jgi:hypothetical protein